MDSFENVRKAFAPLGERLHFFESELHLVQNNEHDIVVNQHDFYHIDIINKLGRDVNSFDTFQVYVVATEYLLRVHRIQGLLGQHRKKTRKIPAAKWELWGNEIYEYLHELLSILDAREESYQTDERNNRPIAATKSIQLSKDFTIKEMQLHFKPKYHHSTIALLMYYMSKSGILPPYEQGEFGKIAPIFGFHDKTIPKDIRNINPDSKSDLTKVKTVVETLLENISEDLAKAKKR